MGLAGDEDGGDVTRPSRGLGMKPKPKSKAGLKKDVNPNNTELSNYVHVSRDIVGW
jgi:hypothetical protein